MVAGIYVCPALIILRTASRIPIFPDQQILVAFFVGILAGVRGFAQLTLLRADERMRQLVRLLSFPSTAMFTRFLCRFSATTVTEMFGSLFVGYLACLSEPRAG